MLQHTTTFHHICNAGSLRQAAQHMGVSTSTVSRQLDHLEQELGAQLVNRGGQEITLTEVGRIYRAETEAVLEGLANGKDAVREALEHPAGRLTIAAPAAIVQQHMGVISLHYLKQYPDVRLEILTRDGDVFPDGTNIHIVLAVTRTPPPEHLMRRVIGRMPMMLCASPDYIAEHGSPDHPHELVDRRCIVLGSGAHSSLVPFERNGEKVTVKVGAALFTNSVGLARRAALAGRGPVGLPISSCAKYLKSGKLVPMMSDWTLVSVPVAAYTARRQVPLRVRLFLDLLDHESCKVAR